MEYIEFYFRQNKNYFIFNELKILFKLSLKYINYYFYSRGMGDGGWGIGDWGWGFGDWGLGPIPNPQSPIPNPQSPIPNKNIIKFLYIYIFN